MIPKVIHYCWLSGDPLPENLKKCMESWEKIIPDYVFVKWDSSKFDIDSCIWVKEAFQNKKYAFAADYIRLYAIYNYGGIYLDMDIEVVKRFDDLLNNQYMLAFEGYFEGGIEAGCFGAEKGAEYIGRCLEYYKNRHFIMQDGTFNMLPLPKIMQKELNTKGIFGEIYPSSYFTAKSFITGIVSITEKTYCIHHFAGSWKTEKEQKIIMGTQKLHKLCGKKIARNSSEMFYTIKYDGVTGLIELVRRKLERKVSGMDAKN